MNIFDKQRIENAIWMLEQYKYLVNEIAKDLEWDESECEKTFDFLDDIKSHLNVCLEDVK